MASLFGEKFYSLSGEFSLYGHRPVVVHVDLIPNQLGCVYTQNIDVRPLREESLVLLEQITRSVFRTDRTALMKECSS